MSASDEEAFESAEEGESGKAEAKATIEKPKQSSESSKNGASKGGGDKGGGKQKGKQQQTQQQRKAKAKPQPKPAAEKKEKSIQKKHVVEKSKASPSSGTKEDKPESMQETKDETEIEAKYPASSEKSVEKSAESGSEKQELVTDKEKEVQREVKIAEKVGNKQRADQTNTSKDFSETKDKSSETQGKPSETQGKSAGEIRQSLSSSTEDRKVKNPADQSISRDSDDAIGESAGEGNGKQVSESSEDDGSWNWGWGSSLLNAATNSLETFSSQVGEGLTTIIDTVESSFGVPDPRDLAKADSSEELAATAEDTETVTVQPHEREGSEEPSTQKDDTTAETEKEEGASGGKAEEEKDKSESGSSWLSGWGMSSISSMGKSLVNKSQNLMNTGFEKAENLAAGGLDILETIGKKTYTTLTEHDPGLRRAREFLHLREEKPSLSSVLKDAREQAEEEAKHKEEFEEARKCQFSALFEDNQGLAHLEALEMLSDRSERKVQSLLSAMDEDTLESIRLQLLDIKDIFQKACDADDKEQTEETEHDFSKLVAENLSELHLGTAPDKLNKVQETVRQWIADFYSHEDHSEISDPKEVQQRAIQSLADVTSKAVEQFHKAGELVLMQKEEDKRCTHRAQSLARLCSVLVTEVDILANKFSQCLNKIGEEKNGMEEVGPMVTSVYLEAAMPVDTSRMPSSFYCQCFSMLLFSQSCSYPCLLISLLRHAALQSYSYSCLLMSVLRTLFFSLVAISVY